MSGDLGVHVPNFNYSVETKVELFGPSAYQSKLKKNQEFGKIPLQHSQCSSAAAVVNKLVCDSDFSNFLRQRNAVRAVISRFSVSLKTICAYQDSTTPVMRRLSHGH